ncbi:PREDICTED: uncharacterized protein LOC104589890 isoform X2 [Nelumbo nucifera]|uniref:Uncharacterized protein LOC104589890 isoform X2 n=1 Tax=Nelumbo nucifera TaxID=4432 RepID=A0A1U8Q1L8_NELNU|nr:PREDICTED: uncharacterized protein LOC104589890 isoform X2 [Nelumbo nucifera]
MSFAKLVGYSFGINEVVPSAVESQGFGGEEKNSLKFIRGRLGGSIIPANDVVNGVLHGSSLNLGFGAGTTGRGNGGSLDYSSPHGVFSGDSEGAYVNAGKPLNDFGTYHLGTTMAASRFKGEAAKSGSGASRKYQKKGMRKTSKEQKGDPDWLPKQETGIGSSDVKKKGNSVRRRSTTAKRSQNGKTQLEEDVGTVVSKSVVQCLPAPDGLKHPTLPSGWVVKAQEGGRDPLYISPSGTVYGPLSKVLDASSNDAFNCRERQRGSSRSMDDDGLHGNLDSSIPALGRKNGPLIAQVDQQGRTKPEIESVATRSLEEELFNNSESSKESSSIPVEMGSEESQNVMAHCMLYNTGRTCRKDQSLSTETKKKNFSSMIVTENSGKHNNDMQRDAIGVQLSNGKHVPVDNESDIETRLGEDLLDSSKCVFILKGDMLVKKLETDEEREALLLREEKEYKRAPEAVVVKEKVKSSTHGECLNRETQGLNCCSKTLTKDAQDRNAGIGHNGELHGVRRSLRINGRHVPVHTELDIETRDDDYFLDSLPSDLLLGKHEPEDENDEEASPVQEEMRYREVNEVLASCIADEKVKDKSCSSLGMLTVDIQVELRKPEKENDNEASVMPAELRCNESNEVMSSDACDIRKSCNLVDISVQDMPLVQETEKENAMEALPIPGESKCQKAHNILESCVADGKAKPQTKYEHVSNNTKKLDSSASWIFKNDQDRGIEVVGVRRSKRINGKHVPIHSEWDIDIWTLDDLLGSTQFAVNDVAIKDKKKSRNSISEVDSVKGNLTAVEDVFQTATRKHDNKKPRDQKQLKCNSTLSKPEKMSKKVDGIKVPVSEKLSPTLKNNRGQDLMSEKYSSPCASKRKAVGGGHSNCKKKKKRSGGCGLIVRRTGKGDCKENILSETRVGMLSWMIDTGTVAESEKVVYKTNDGKSNITRGCITRGGIWCNCCRKHFSLLEFEAHAGSDLRQPWINTFTVSGKSLLQCLREAWEKEKNRRRIAYQTVGVGDADPSDDTCGICADGGHLICCDACPSTFHQDCILLKSLPEGSWYCPMCRCAFCMLVDHDQDKPGQARQLLNCNQCGCKYHRECTSENVVDKDSKLFSFCGTNCKKVAERLSNMLGISNPLGGGFSWTLLKRMNEDEDTISGHRLSFIMECNVKLSLALSVLDECFSPLVDPRTGLNMISQAVYSCGSNYNRLNCEGFYTIILEKDDEIVSVATLRLHGVRLAEMPFIGTRPIHRRKGMCRRLLRAIEEMLSSLHVEKLIIPAISDLLETWMTSFSFKPLELSHKDEIRNLSMMIFLETTLLQKSLCSIKTDDTKDKQVDSVGTCDKGIDRTGDSHSTDGPVVPCFSCPENSQHGLTGSTLKPLEDPSSTEDVLPCFQAKASSGCVSELLPTQSTSVRNLEMVPQNL